MSSFLDSIGGSIGDGLIPAAAGVVVGLVVWAAGRRILRPALAIMGVLVGGAIGWSLGWFIDVGVSAAALAIGGAAVGGLACWIGSRIAVAGAMSLLLAALAPAALWLAHEHGWYRPAAAMAADSPTKVGGLYFFDEEGNIENAPPSAPPTLPAPSPESNSKPGGDASQPMPSLEDMHAMVEEKLDSLAGALEQAKQAADVLSSGRAGDDAGAFANGSAATAAQDWLDPAAEAWEQLPVAMRLSLMIAAIGGALAGFVLGLAWRSFSAVVATAAVGAAVLLAASASLLAHFPASDGLWQPTEPVHWLGLWLIIAILGAGIQCTLRPRPADKPA